MTVGNGKRSKYGNRRVECLGEQFDSILERDRWLVLRKWEADGVICNLARQLNYSLTAHGRHICYYRCDFDFIRNGVAYTEDAKGVLTDVFRLKAKMFEAQTGRRIHIVTKKTLHQLPEAP